MSTETVLCCDCLQPIKKGDDMIGVGLEELPNGNYTWRKYRCGECEQWSGSCY